MQVLFKLFHRNITHAKRLHKIFLCIRFSDAHVTIIAKPLNFEKYEIRSFEIPNKELILIAESSYDSKSVLVRYFAIGTFRQNCPKGHSQ